MKHVALFVCLCALAMAQLPKPGGSIGNGGGGAPAAHKASHQDGGLDALALAQSQITGLADALAAKQATITGAPGTWPSFGDAALKNTGTSAGTVAAGNDSRFTQTLPESQEPAHDGDVTNSAGDLTLALATKFKTMPAMVTIPYPVVADGGVYPLLDAPVAIHLTRVFCSVQGSTNVVVNLDKRPESAIGTDTGSHLLGSDLTATSSGANTTTFSNTPCSGTGSCAVAANNLVYVTITSVSGTPTALTCTATYTID